MRSSVSARAMEAQRALKTLEIGPLFHAHAKVVRRLMNL
jgi:hypothetical protein